MEFPEPKRGRSMYYCIGHTGLGDSQGDTRLDPCAPGFIKPEDQAKPVNDECVQRAPC